MSIEQEIRNEIDNIKQLKIDVGDINNHLSALEGLCRKHNQKVVDEAYQRGYADKTNNDKVCKELAKDVYQRGFDDGKAVYDKGCDGCKYAGKVVTGPPCISCCNSYKNQWMAKEKDDEIKVGDVVERYVNGKFDSTGIFLGEGGGYWNCLFWTGAVFTTLTYPKNQFKKTVIHLGIDKIMEEMRK